MKVYIAGKLSSPSEKYLLEEIDSLCKSLGLETFLPHRDVGICKNSSEKELERIFKGDIEQGFNSCDLVIADLNGLHVGAGTAWELGYAYANKIPTIGIKSDESKEEALEYLSAILLHSMPIVSSLEELKEKIKETLNLKV